MSDAAEGRLAPLKPEEWDASLAEVLADLKNPLSIHNVVARNPVLMANYVDFRNHIVKSSSLSGRQRELIILRVAHNTACAYEWDHHVVRGRDAGLQDHEIARVRHGGDAEGWTTEESLLLKAVDNMIAGTEIARPNWVAMCGVFVDNQLLDIIFTIGTYMIMSTILKTAQVPHEDGFKV
ncbi:MAG: carboxymuconolactone decarboxylase family protein, partial [Rhodospirillaceae bacterium]|nr:carboxymuconolactone decarboxylase family protein [Rhodospirillaceae bacterium]